MDDEPQEFWERLSSERARVWSGRVNAALEREADLAEELPRGPYDLASAQFLQSPVALPRIEVLRRAAAEVAPDGVLLVVGHAAPPPWSQHDPDPSLMPEAAEVVAQLGLPEVEWEAVRVAEVARGIIGPDGQAADLVDSVVLLGRR